MTQAELDRLLAAVIDEAKQADIPVSHHICPSVKINRRAKTRFGSCRWTGKEFVVEISAFLLEAEEKAIRQTLVHELLHTCPSCADHGPRWKSWAARMNALYGYAIRRADSHESLGLTDERPIRWLVVCDRCGKETGRMKRSPLVDRPERYRCRCGGMLFVKDAEILF